MSYSYRCQGDERNPENQRSRGKRMKDILMNEFYSGSTVADAVDFIERCYGKKVSERVLENTKNNIKNLTGKDWK